MDGLTPASKAEANNDIGEQLKYPLVTHLLDVTTNEFQKSFDLWLFSSQLKKIEKKRNVRELFTWWNMAFVLTWIPVAGHGY